MGTVQGIKQLAKVFVVSAIFCGIALAQDEGEKESADLDAVAEALLNPLSDLWFLAVQNDTFSYTGTFDGGSSRTVNSLKLQPVMAVPLTKDFNMIVRPIIQYMGVDYPQLTLEDPTLPITRDSFSLDFDKVRGLGDSVLLTSFGKAEPIGGKFVFAVGPTFMLPTASKDELRILQNDKWAVGPSVLAVSIGEKWVLGALVQHWFGVGDRTQKVRINIPENDQDLELAIDGDDLNLTDLMYIVRYRLSAQTNIGAAPNVNINWNASGSDRFTVPIGIGFDTMS